MSRAMLNASNISLSHFNIEISWFIFYLYNVFAKRTFIQLISNHKIFWVMTRKRSEQEHVLFFAGWFRAEPASNSSAAGAAAYIGG